MSTFDKIIEKKKNGSLKIILGYSPGVGKTFSMLNEAHSLKAQGFDIVIGYVERHKRSETLALLKGLEEIPVKTIEHSQQKFGEMDVDAVIARHPQIVLVDEMAHTNIQGSRNPKRYMDILEIISHGINVITTLNVQHLESVADRVTETIKVPVHERIPDHILELADQVVTVDVSLEDLRERMRLGKIYELNRADDALSHFFTYHNLAFLREMCLREVVGTHVYKVEKDENEASEGSAGEEPIMVALSPNTPSGTHLIKKAAKFASRTSSPFYVVFVQNKSNHPAKIDEMQYKRLQNQFMLASSLGGEVKIITSQHAISDVLINFAYENKIRHAFFGQSHSSPLVERLRGSILLDFLHDSVGIDVHILASEGKEKDDV